MSKAPMVSCMDIVPLLVFYAYGETTERERDQVDTHLAACPSCAAQLAEERALHEALRDSFQPSERLDPGGILLSQCRSELAETLDDLSSPPMREHWQPFGWLRRWMALRPAWSGALLVLFGLVLGTQLAPWFAQRSDTSAPGQTLNISPAPRLTDDQLAKMAVAGINLAPAPDAPPGTLQLQMRTEQPLVLSGSVDDPDVRRVLTYVVENGDRTDPGLRMDCLEALRTRSDNLEVRGALLGAARKDQNPAVRLKALESLQDSVADKSVREALIDALEGDPNPGVRVEAVNLLVRSLGAGSLEVAAAPQVHAAPQATSSSVVTDESIDRAIRTLQELQHRDPNRYVRLRSAAALRQIGPRELQ